MKQYIKKVLWIIPFVFSLNLSGATFKFASIASSWSSPANGSLLTNWTDISTGNNPTASDFTNSSNTFDVNGRFIDIGGLTIGDITFINSVQRTTPLVTVTNGKTLEITSENPPIFSSTPYFVNGRFDKAGSTVLYSFSSTSTNQVVFNDGSLWGYANLSFSGSNKTIDFLKFSGTLTELSGKTVEVGLSGAEFTTNSSFNVLNTTKFILNYTYEFLTAPFSYIYDARTVKNYPGIWEFADIGIYSLAGDYGAITSGTYYKIIVSADCKLIGDITVQNNLDMSASNSLLILNDKTLTVGGTITSNALKSKFVGSSNSSIVCQGNGTLYFDQAGSNENRTLKNLTIGGSGVTVTLGNWLNITGGTSTSGYGVVDVIAASNNLYTQGYLTLKSNEYGTAMISSSPGNIAYNSSSNNGTLLMENYIAGNSTKGRQYRFLSSPVSGGVFWQWRDSSNSRSGRGTHITGKTGTVNIANDSFDISTTNHPSAFYYDETKAGNTTGIGNTSASEDAGWSRLINAKTGTIENGKGYRVLIRGDRSITLTSSTTTTPINTTIQTRGGYVAGPVSVPITNSSTKTNNGINLVGNPYACAVDWVTVQSNSTSVDPTYVAFDVSSKSYQSYNATGGGGLMSRYISPGQGFLVYTTAASTNLVFPTTSKTTAQAGGRIFTEIKNNHLVTRLMKDSGTYDATIIYFIKGATNYYDAYDAGHIENSNVNLSSLDSTNTLYNLNCMDSLIGTRIIPLSLYGTPTGTYTMAFDDVNTFKNHDVYLIDKYLQKTTKVDDMTQYQVNVNTDKFSYAEGRLAISFEPKPMTSVVTLNKTDIFNIFPNPVKDQLNVKMDNQLMGTIEYEIFNISGQSMMSGAFNSKETKINTSKLTTGIYFINLRANNETQTIKFIK